MQRVSPLNKSRAHKEKVCSLDASKCTLARSNMGKRNAPCSLLSALRQHGQS